jgi:hypothetical protein
VAGLALFGLLLIPFGLLEKVHLPLVALIAVGGLVWLFFIAPNLSRRFVLRKLGYEFKYFGRYRRGSYFAFVDHRQRRFCVWDEGRFTLPYRYWRPGKDDT